ncbi:MAG: choice-of-anchor D domain-containing protein [Bacteroidota bacterium]
MKRPGFTKVSLMILLINCLVIQSFQGQGQNNTNLSLNKSPGSTVVTILLNSYTYPTAISSDGTHVIGSPFGGGATYFWSAGAGIVNFAGDCYGVSDGGTVSGTYSNSSVLYNGNNVNTAGTWNHSNSTWTFLGMNPAVPNLFSTDYNVGYDITSDGSTVVGMQWYPNYSVSAFKWTQSGGYQMIGSGVGSESRANGISANGSVVCGWAQVGSVNRTPVIWYNSQVIFINNGLYGEAFGASTTGNYVTGSIDNEGFIWSPQGTVLFSNTLNSSSISPTSVTNDGTVFGYTNSNPALRRAFARDPQGNLMLFNDYAAARGLPDAQLWTFYSINDVSADGLKVVGAGKNPAGASVTFLMEFIPEIPIFFITPSSLNFGEIPVGSQSAFSELKITNSGAGTLVIDSVKLSGGNSSHYILNDTNSYPLYLNVGDTSGLSVAFKPTSMGLKLASLQLFTNTGNQQVPLSGTGGYGIGIFEQKAGFIQVYPVPANDVIHVSSTRELESIRIYNDCGQLVYSGSGLGSSIVTIEVTDFKEGSYLLICKGRDGIIFRNSVIVRSLKH